MTLKSFQLVTLLIAALYFSSTGLYAQAENLQDDIEFFNSQKKVYQRWLDDSGLGELLSIADLDVKPDRLSLYLKFPFEEINQVMAAWKQLKKDFEAHSTLTLEQALFYKAVHFMEVDQKLVDVQIYDTYDLMKEPLFMRGIHFEAGRVDVEENNPKSKIRKVAIQPIDLKGLKEPSLETLRGRFSKARVFDVILDYSRRRFDKQLYKGTDCAGRFPYLRLLEQGEVLRFETTDLCREVIKDAQNPYVCSILQQFGRACNWIRREKLEFIITHTPTDQGFILGVEIDGKYGSGRYDQVPRGGYYSMEVDFDDYLTDYADEMATIFRKVVVNLKP